MVAGGLAIVLAGMLILWGGRLGIPARAERLEAEGSAKGDPRWLRGASESTRLVVGVCALIGGYHLAIWALPPDSTPVQVPRRLWWVLIGALVMVVGGSFILDRVESGRGSGRTAAGGPCCNAAARGGRGGPELVE
jgi:hypothetical protein